MSGHSKWHSIKHKKAKEDAKRGNMFGKLSRNITVAAREGNSGDPDNNITLANAIAKAKEFNMPADNIDRAIKRGTGEIEGAKYERIIYEGYGPGGIAIMVEAMTENKNRTAADIRNIFSKYGGNLGESGCVNWMFERKGLILIDKDNIGDGEEFMLEVIDLGAEDIQEQDNFFEVTTKPDDFMGVIKGLDSMDIKVRSSEVVFSPSSTVEPDSKDAAKTMKLIDILDDHDDVQSVNTNLEITDEMLSGIQD
jgi:YebC/PmpR family DNA-binding regulatory protein